MSVKVRNELINYLFIKSGYDSNKKELCESVIEMNK